MSQKMTGREALYTLDRSLVRLRRKLGAAMSNADSLASRETIVRNQQVQAYQALAKIRLDLIEKDDTLELDRLHREADRLLSEHDEFVLEEARQLSKAEQKISDLEVQRAEQLDERSAHLETYETLVAQTEATLSEDKTYQALVMASDEAASIADRAEKKLIVAREERDEKGEPYRSDPLFSYLWERKYRTPEYKAGPFTRFMDGWVAGLCKYDNARANFARLTDLPKWLEEHSEACAEAADTAQSALEAAESQALERAGAPKAREAAAKCLKDIERTDAEIVQAETRHRVLAEAHAKAVSGADGPAREARRLLEDGLGRMSFQDLRTLAAETLTLEDDDLVDDLVKLRTEQLSIEVESEAHEDLPLRLKQDLSRVETLRRKFKSARFDSDYATFKSVVFDDVVSGLLEGRLSVDDGFRQLRRSVRRKEPRTRRGFGGARRQKTLGLPDVLGDVAWEVLRQSGKSSRGFPTSGSSSRRGNDFPFPSGRSTRKTPKSRPNSRPRRSGKRGGWHTGGGF